MVCTLQLLSAARQLQCCSTCMLCVFAQSRQLDETISYIAAVKASQELQCMYAWLCSLAQHTTRQQCLRLRPEREDHGHTHTVRAKATFSKNTNLGPVLAPHPIPQNKQSFTSCSYSSAAKQLHICLAEMLCSKAFCFVLTRHTAGQACFAHRSNKRSNAATLPLNAVLHCAFWHHKVVFTDLELVALSQDAINTSTR